jgi:hypothetical protein
MNSQSNQILAFLNTGQSLTALDALRKFGCLRLAARVKELRDRGERIGANQRLYVTREGKRKHIACYWIPRR